MSEFQIVHAGDSTLVVEFKDRIDAAINRRAVAVAEGIIAARLPGVRDVVPTYRSVAVYFDPLRTDGDSLLGRLTGEAERSSKPQGDVTRPIRVPVCYGGEFGPDLGAVAVFGGG